MINVIKGVLKLLRYVALPLDLVLLPITVIASLWFRIIKYVGLNKFRLTKYVFNTVGAFPIVKHYYEPQYDFRGYKQRYRKIPSINFNDLVQVQELNSFCFQDELLKIPQKKVSHLNFYYENGSFCSGDAECYYSIIRKYRPSRIIEIGSGFSTLIAQQAIIKNQQDDVINTKLTCIEPYEMHWLKEMDVELIRKKVEDVDLSLFKKLNSGDILFIDSSHVIRPEGDVLFEILQILPILNKGVMIHFHDIFTPFNYPESWLKEEFRLWNEQYLLESFLSHNDTFEVMLAMSYVTHHHATIVHKTFPVLGQTPNSMPGSFWIRKIK